MSTLSHIFSKRIYCLMSSNHVKKICCNITLENAHQQGQKKKKKTSRGIRPNQQPQKENSGSCSSYPVVKALLERRKPPPTGSREIYVWFRNTLTYAFFSACVMCYILFFSFAAFHTLVYPC